MDKFFDFLDLRLCEDFEVGGSANVIGAVYLELGIGFGRGYFGALWVLVEVFRESVIEVVFLHYFVLGHRLNHISKLRVMGQI